MLTMKSAWFLRDGSPRKWAPMLVTLAALYAILTFLFIRQVIVEYRKALGAG
jgi:hypothetical protein